MENYLHESGRPYTKEEFVEKIKIDKEFATKWGELGLTYGKQWRQWQGWMQTSDGTMGSLWYDQILSLINDLKTNPNSRRLMVNAWNVADVDSMTLPPCHYGFQCYTRELSPEERVVIFNKKHGIESPLLPMLASTLNEQNIPTRELSLSWNQRSVDTFLGLPFNIASYGLLLEILAKITNMVPGELIGKLGDTHLYLNHIEQAKEQIGKKMTTDERNKWFDENWGYGGNKGGKNDWKDYELDQQNVPKRTREPFELPTLQVDPHNLINWQSDLDLILEHIGQYTNIFVLENYKSHSSIKAPLSN